jgi:carboxymethylenebutenolidase
MDKNTDSTILGDVSRRDFTAGSVAAATLVAAAGPAAAADVVETDVTIKTPDGNADAAYFHPATGKHPAVIIWTDIFGLRPSFRAMGRRLAAEGYTVLVPNPFYRTAKAPVVVDASTFDFNDPASRAKTAAWTGPINVSGAIEKDAGACIAWLDSQKEVDTAKKIGTQGYCMGGPLVFKTVALSQRVGAGATFHGGGLVTDKPDSPHTLIPKMKANMYLAIAASDDDKQPDAKDKLKAAFEAAHLKAKVVVYTGMAHGWTVPDMPPAAPGKPIYNKPEAERAWTNLLKLYKTSIA